MEYYKIEPILCIFISTDLDQLPSEMSAKNKPLSKQTYEAARDEEKRGNDDISVKYPR